MLTSQTPKEFNMMINKLHENDTVRVDISIDLNIDFKYMHCSTNDEADQYYACPDRGRYTNKCSIA